MTGLVTRWRAVSAMFLLNGAILGLWSQRIPEIADKHGLGAQELSWVLLCLAAGAILSFPVAGRLSDWFGAVRMTRLFAFINLISLVFLALAPVAPLAIFLVLAVLFFGASHGSLDVVMNSWATEIEADIGKPVMSSFHALWSFGAGLGAFSAYWASLYDVSILNHFVFGSLALLIFCMPFAFLSWTSPINREPTQGAIFKFPRGILVLVGFLAFFSALTEGGMLDWSKIFMLEVTATTVERAALGYTVFQIAMVIMRLIGDRLVRAFGAVRVTQACGFAATVGASAAVLSGNYYITLVGFGLMGAGVAVLFPLAFSRAAAENPSNPGASIASVATLGYGGLLLAPAIIGFITEATSIRFAFLIFVLAGLGILLLASSLKNQTSPN